MRHYVKYSRQKGEAVSYQERRSIFNLISSILITVFYCAYMIRRYPQAEAYSQEVFQYWGSFFLILVIVSIVVKLIVYIIFSVINTVVTKEQEPSIIDERDQMIELKSARNGGYVFIIGFLIAMIFNSAGQVPALMFVILLCAGLASDMISSISEFFYYRRGV